MLGFDVPVVEHPLEGEVEVAEGCVGIEEDNPLVVLDMVGKGGWLDPCSVAVLEIRGVD